MFQLHAIFFILMDSIKHKKMIQHLIFLKLISGEKGYQIEFHD